MGAGIRKRSKAWKVAWLLLASSPLYAGEIVGLLSPGDRALVQVSQAHEPGSLLFVVEEQRLLAYLQVEKAGPRQLTARLHPLLKEVGLDTLLSRPVTSVLPEGYTWYRLEATVIGTSGDDLLYVNAPDTSGFMESELVFLEAAREDSDQKTRHTAYVEDVGETQSTLRLIEPDTERTRRLLDARVTIRFAAEKPQPVVPTMLAEMPDGRRVQIKVPIELTLPEWERPSENPWHLVVDTSRNRLYAYKGGEVAYNFPVGTGRFGLETPPGLYEIIDKVERPDWMHPSGRVIPGGSPSNPLGQYWLGLNKFGTYKGYEGQYGLHGTNKPGTVGRYVSHGCIRLHNEDIAQLFRDLPIGTPVEIRHGGKPMAKNTL